MFLKVFSSKQQLEIAINSDRILYIEPSYNGGSVIYIESNITLHVNNTYSDLITELNKIDIKTPDKEVLLCETVSVDKEVSDDEYPANIPRLPSGNIDKRSLEYRKFVGRS